MPRREVTWGPLSSPPNSQVVNPIAEAQHCEARVASANSGRLGTSHSNAAVSVIAGMCGSRRPAGKVALWAHELFLSIPASYGISRGCVYIGHLVNGLQNGEKYLEGVAI